jgi:hypothetical protein
VHTSLNIPIREEPKQVEPTFEELSTKGFLKDLEIYNIVPPIEEYIQP